MSSQNNHQKGQFRHNCSQTHAYTVIAIPSPQKYIHYVQGYQMVEGYRIQEYSADNFHSFLPTFKANILIVKATEYRQKQRAINNYNQTIQTHSSTSCSQIQTKNYNYFLCRSLYIVPYIDCYTVYIIHVVLTFSV